MSILNSLFSHQAIVGSDPLRLDINEAIVAKWNDAFKDELSLSESIKNPTTRRHVTQMLEYQYQDMGGDANANINMRLDEADADSNIGASSNVAGTNAGNFDPVLIKMVRKVAPSLIHHGLVGVQPMNAPTGLIFAMKSYYVNKDGTKGDEVQPEGIAGAAGAPKVGFSGGFKNVTQENVHDKANRYSTAEGEKLGTQQLYGDLALGGNLTVKIDPKTIWPEMTFSIEKQSVTAETRALKARYTDELVSDLKSVHGLNARDELANILSTEVVSEQNRELVMLLANQAKQGCASGTAVAGTFNLNTDADGRWAIEKFKGLLLRINKEAHIIALETRRGVGNTLIAHSDIVAALDMAGVIDKNIVTGDMNVDGVGVTYAGKLNGRFSVYVDPYAAVPYILVGFKGNNAYDCGVIFAPYVPLQFMEARDSESFQPVIGIKSRYGMATNPMVGTYNGGNDLAATKGKNPYYRLFLVTGM